MDPDWRAYPAPDWQAELGDEWAGGWHLSVARRAAGDRAWRAQRARGSAAI